MDNNDILRRIRYTFEYSDSQMIDIFAKGDMTVTRAEVSSWMKREDDDDFTPMKDIEIASFLNGFIVLKRGSKDGPKAIPERQLDNNIILRKMKIALNLKDVDVVDIIDLAGITVSKHEISAFFRKKGQGQYRPCLDQFLRNFFQGLQKKYRNT